MNNDRFAEMARHIIDKMTREELESYAYDTGLLGLIDDIGEIIHTSPTEKHYCELCNYAEDHMYQKRYISSLQLSDKELDHLLRAIEDCFIFYHKYPIGSPREVDVLVLARVYEAALALRRNSEAE